MSSHHHLQARKDGRLCSFPCHLFLQHQSAFQCRCWWPCLAGYEKLFFYVAKHCSHEGGLKLPDPSLTVCICLFWREMGFIICFHSGTIWLCGIKTENHPNPNRSDIQSVKQVSDVSSTTWLHGAGLWRRSSAAPHCQLLCGLIGVHFKGIPKPTCQQVFFRVL